jgi:transcription factor C subunit 7
VSSRSTGEDGKGEKFAIRVEPGVGEWYGAAPFEHPTSAAPEVLKSMFPAIDLSYQGAVRPPRMGESLQELHDRVAAAMQDIVYQCDREGIRAIVICTHAAVVIALGRVLTGAMPDSVEVEDFQAFTCGLSVYRRKVAGSASGAEDNSSLGRVSGDAGAARANTERDLAQVTPTPQPASSSFPQIRAERLHIPAWKGRGVAGGWQCTANSDCSHLTAGEERGW